jgi:protocatechuate 3,4-dioxygenase beta subunit
MNKQLFAIVLLCALNACAAGTVTTLPITMTVVDAATGEPIAGANVTANWMLEEPLIHGRQYRDMLEVMETVTDENGKFTFPSFTKSHRYIKELNSSSPHIIIFKPGYKFRSMFNQCPEQDRLCDFKQYGFAYSGETTKLERIQESIYTQKKFSDPYQFLDSAFNPILDTCNGIKAPKMIMALVHERERVMATYKQALWSLPNREYIDSFKSKCGADFASLEKNSK